MTVRNKPEKRQRPEPHNSSRMRRFIQRARTEGTDLENAGSTVHGVERDRNDLEVPTRTPADHPRPDFGVRLLSLSIDYGLILAYLAVLVLVALGGYALTRSLHDWLSLGTAGAELLGFVFLVLPVGIYLYLGEASERQATVGKRLLSLRVVDAATGGRLAKPRVLVRTIVKLLPWEVAHFFVWQAVALSATGGTGADGRPAQAKRLVESGASATGGIFLILSDPHRPAGRCAGPSAHSRFHLAVHRPVPSRAVDASDSRTNSPTCRTR